MVQGENSGTRRRNKRRGKGRNQTAPHSSRAVNGHDRSDSSSSNSPAQTMGRAGGTVAHSTSAFLTNILMDMSPYNMSRLLDAETKFYSSKQSQDTPAASEEVDLFASDEEVDEKPARVKPAPKAKQTQQTPNKAKGAAPKAAEAPAWPNKAECNDAEAKFQAQLSKNPGAFRNEAYGERTFIMLKPDAVQRGLIGEILERFESRGFKLVACKFMSANKDLLMTHYSDLSKKAFFPELIRYMSSGPVVPMVWEGLNAVKQGRVMLGATNPKDSDPGTIRGDLCVDVGRNIIHGSDSLESAAKEISLWFKPEELSKWRSAQVEWCYEEEELAKGQSVAPQPSHTVDTLATGLSSSEEMALVKKLNALETENKQLKKVTDDLKALVLSLEARVGTLEGGKPAAKATPAAAPAAEDDDDVDLFGSDDEEEDEEKKRITEERLKAYHEKKAKKPQVIAKTSVLFDVKPWDDETPHEKMLEACKSIEKDGLVWGASKLVPIGYGIKKLQIMCTVEDAKVSIEELGEQIEAFEDYVQSVDVAAMNKI